MLQPERRLLHCAKLSYCGAFARGNNWLIGWTAAWEFGLTTQERSNEFLGHTAIPGVATGCDPVLYHTGNWAAGTSVQAVVTNLNPLGALGVVAFGFTPLNPFDPCGGVDLTGIGLPIIVPDANNGALLAFLSLGGGTATAAPIALPAGFPAGTQFYTQAITLELDDSFGSSNAQRHTTQ